MEQFEAAQTAIRNAIDEAVGTQTILEIVSGMDEWGLGVRERESLEQSIGDYVQVTAHHLIKLKMRQNMLVAINRLPIELFTCIIFFAKLPMDHMKHPFIRYTWVCHHWRSALIQDSQFWTSLQVRLKSKHHVVKPSIYELLRRSNTAKLNAEISIKSLQPNVQSTIRELIAKENKRIHRLWLSADERKLIQSVFSKSCFSSLKAVTYVGRSRGLTALLPVLVASKQLDTLQCTLGLNFSPKETKELRPVFNRLRNLSLSVYLPETLLSVLHALHNNNLLRELQLTVHKSDESKLNETRLPELRSLFVNSSWIIENFRTPKLSGLSVGCSSVVRLNFLNHPIFEEFDLSSIKCLYILDPTNCRGVHVIGVTNPIHASQLFSRKSEGFAEDTLFFDDIKTRFTVADITLQSLPRDYFNIEFPFSQISDKVLEQALSFVLPRLTSLTELYILSHALMGPDGIPLAEILSRNPNVEKLTVQYGNGLIQDFIRLLSNPSVCPRLKHLSYTLSRSASRLHEDMEHFVESDVGKVLIECLQSRREVLGEILEFVALGNCLPLSDGCLKELQRLGTAVVIDREC